MTDSNESPATLQRPLGLLPRTLIGAVFGLVFAVLMLPFHLDPFRGWRGMLASAVAAAVFFGGIGALGPLRKMPIPLACLLAGSAAGLAWWAIAPDRPAAAVALVVGGLLGLAQSLEAIGNRNANASEANPP